MTIKQMISPCLWFDDQAQQAAEFYNGIFGVLADFADPADEEARYRKA